MSHNVDQALKRPRDYASLTPEHQWAIDARLGILDWDPTPEEIEEYKRRLKERQKAKLDIQFETSEAAQDFADTVKERLGSVGIDVEVSQEMVTFSGDPMDILNATNSLSKKLQDIGEIPVIELGGGEE